MNTGLPPERQGDAAFVRQVIELSGLSLRRVAVTAGVSANFLSLAQHGRSGIGAEVRERLEAVPAGRAAVEIVQVAQGLVAAARAGVATLPAAEVAAYQRRADELRAEVAALKQQARIRNFEIMDVAQGSLLR